MPKFFQTVVKIKPAYDITYKIVLFICKLLLTADLVITSVCVVGRYVPFVPDPAWSEEVVLTLMSYMAVLSAALAIRRNAHIRMTAFDQYLPKSVIRALDILADVAVLILGVVMISVDFLCSPDRCKKEICKYAKCFKILDVFPNPTCRNCNGGI